MSLTTTADERIITAKDHIELALKALQDATYYQTWGYDEFTSEYREKIVSATDELYKMLKEL